MAGAERGSSQEEEEDLYGSPGPCCCKAATQEVATGISISTYLKRTMRKRALSPTRAKRRPGRRGGGDGAGDRVYAWDGKKGAGPQKKRRGRARRRGTQRPGPFFRERGQSANNLSKWTLRERRAALPIPPQGSGPIRKGV
jgi:hypothetical protein